MISFEEITNKNIWKVCALEPFEEQKDFVAENIQSLAEAYATRNEGNNALPLAVYNDDDLIGFIMIGKGTVGNPDESDLIKENYCFWRFMIDKKLQGKGYGSAALQEIIKYFKDHGANNIRLSTKESNVNALSMYRKAGFCDTREMNDEEIVLKLDL